MFADVTKRNLSAVVEAAGDNATVVEYCNMSVKRTASAGDSFVFDAFGVRCCVSVMPMSKLVVATLNLQPTRLSSFVYAWPFEASVLVQIKSPCDIETLVAATKMPGRDFDAESLVDAA